MGIFWARPTTQPQPASAEQATVYTHGLHVYGNKILNAFGQEVKLVGVNRSSFESACLPDDNGNPHPLHDGPADKSEVAAMKSWHINIVRVSLNEDCWLGLHGAVAYASPAAYQEDVANYVNLLTINNIAVVLTLVYATPSGTPDGVLAGIGGRQWPMPNRQHSPDFWVSVATRFMDNSRVIFDVYNEPHPLNSQADGPYGSSEAAWLCWRDGGTYLTGGACQYDPDYWPYEVAGMQELINAIRSTKATNIILVPVNDWSSDPSGWLQYPLSDDQLAVGWHSYGDGLACQNPDCWNTQLAPIMEQYPLIADEIGEFDCGHSYIDQLLAFLDAHNGHYMAHTWGPYGCTADPALITDWCGTPTQTYGQAYKDHLAEISQGVDSGPLPDCAVAQAIDGVAAG